MMWSRQDGYWKISIIHKIGIWIDGLLKIGMSNNIVSNKIEELQKVYLYDFCSPPYPQL